MHSFVLFVLASFQLALAHTGITNLYVNGVNQGDSVCLRINPNSRTWSDPISSLSSDDMACGAGATGVNRVCEVEDGSSLTFEWREQPDQPGSGVIDASHKGPCAVYLKKVDSAIRDPAAGDGWFKIWEDGYDSTSRTWCTEKLIRNGGLMSVNLPHGLVGGAYLIRSELLALHEADKGRPQYFLGCAQIWLKSDGQLVPASTVSIPGNVRIKDASNNFNLYRRPLRLPYINPGPKLATLTRTGRIERTAQKEGLKQWRCICESGSNFCGVDVPDYHNEQGCWRSSKLCWDQSNKCYTFSLPTGDASCQAFEAKCKAIQETCHSSRRGPPNKGVDITPMKKNISIPPPLAPMKMLSIQ